MDPVSMAALAAPIIVKGVEAFSKAAGEKLGGKIDQLAQAVADKFKGDSYAEQTLERAKEKPGADGRQNALIEVLSEKMEGDQDFAEKVRKLVEDVQKEAAQTVFNQKGQTVHGLQTNINEANAPVFSGTFSGPVNVSEIRSKVDQ